MSTILKQSMQDIFTDVRKGEPDQHKYLAVLWKGRRTGVRSIIN